MSQDILRERNLGTPEDYIEIREGLERLAGIGERLKARESERIVDRLLSDFEPDTSYYEFPGGVEVRQISAHLTSFGGQALQYISRSCRLDGNNKGERVRDLEKARDLIGWEIDRISERL